MSSRDSGSGGSFWTTLPGCLTGLAAIIVALTGLYVALAPSRQATPTPMPTATVAPAPPAANQSPQVTPPTTQPTQVVTPAPAPETGFRVVDVFLRADPSDYQGPCPVDIQFTGRISVVGGSGTVSYKFLRSDGANAPVESLTFTGPGSQDISTAWLQLGQTGVTQSGWQQVQILDPGNAQSEPATFAIDCR